MKRSLGWSVLATGLVLVACSSDSTTSGSGGGGAATTSQGGSGGSGGGGTGGLGGSGGTGGEGGSEPDLSCLQLCPHPAYECTGVDTEFGSGSTSEITPTGCTFTAQLPVSGTVEMTLDCLNLEACITTSEGNCAGMTGECYPLTTDGTSFSYMVPNCIQGSLSCNQLSP